MRFTRTIFCLALLTVSPASADPGQEALVQAQRHLTGAGAVYDPTLAAQFFAKGADHGHADAQFYLAMLLSRGMGVGEDKARAVHLFQAATDQGHDLARLKLAEAYFSGAGVAVDYAKAERLFSPLAKAGDGRAHLFLGLIAEAGLVRARNPIAAWGHYDRATGAPWPAIADQALLQRDALARRMSPQDLAAAAGN